MRQGPASNLRPITGYYGDERFVTMALLIVFSQLKAIALAEEGKSQ